MDFDDYFEMALQMNYDVLAGLNAGLSSVDLVSSRLGTPADDCCHFCESFPSGSLRYVAMSVSVQASISLVGRLHLG